MSELQDIDINIARGSYKFLTQLLLYSIKLWIYGVIFKREVSFTMSNVRYTPAKLLRVEDTDEWMDRFEDECLQDKTLRETFSVPGMVR